MHRLHTLQRGKAKLAKETVLCAIMATEKHTTDGKVHDVGLQKQNQTGGALESDCAVVVPASATSVVVHHHSNVGVVRQNSDVSETNSGIEMKNTGPTNSTIKDASRPTNIELHEDPAGRWSTALSTAYHSETDECMQTAGFSAGFVASKELETASMRLQMEHQEDELDDDT